VLAQANPKAIACPTGRKSRKGSVGTEKRNQKWAKVSEQCLTLINENISAGCRQSYNLILDCSSQPNQIYAKLAPFLLV
jgi:hypothetical protein